MDDVLSLNGLPELDWNNGRGGYPVWRLPLILLIFPTLLFSVKTESRVSTTMPLKVRETILKNYGTVTSKLWFEESEVVRFLPRYNDKLPFDGGVGGESTEAAVVLNYLEESDYEALSRRYPGENAYVKIFVPHSLKRYVYVETVRSVILMPLMEEK